MGATGSTQYLAPIYEPLLTQDEEGRPAPALAESWEYNDDGTAVTFTLRPGLTFHDGSVVDAEAVKFYIDRAIDQENSALKGSYNNIEGVVVEDELSFTVELRSVDYQIPYLFSLRAGLITSKEAVEASAETFNSSNPVGAGPFKVVELVPESHIVLEKFEDYWDAGNIHIDRFEIHFGNDPSSLVSAIQTGVYNFANIGPTQLQNARNAGLDIIGDSSLNWSVSFLSLNLNNEPFDDPAVVEAFRHAINPQEFVDTVTLGEGTLTHQPLPAGHLLFNDELETAFSYDPDRARELLADAGYADGLDIILEASPWHGGAPGELVQAQLADVGIDVTISNDPNWSQGYFGKAHTLALYGYVGRNSHTQTLTEHYDVGGVLNLSSPFSSDEFQEAVAELRATPIESPDYLVTARAASAAGFLNGSTIPLFAQATQWVKAPEVSSDFELREGFLSWRGITVGD